MGVQPWYHRSYARVPTIDECYVDDVICRTEAHEQFRRDWLVEQEILAILRSRMNDCFFYEKGTGVQAWGDDAPVDANERARELLHQVWRDGMVRQGRARLHEAETQD